MHLAAILPAQAEAAQAETSLPWRVNGGARAYFESAYMSSTGSFGITRPVAEQYADLNLLTDDFGKLRVDMWVISDLTGQQIDVHQRAFYCWEGTLTYGWEQPLDREERVILDTNGGLLWDWLNGYRSTEVTPVCWYAFQSLRNPWIIPYWNGLGALHNAGGTWTRVRVGLQHDWKPVESVTLSPFVDATWGSPNRFLKNYGDDVGDSFLGGSMMFGAAGVIGRWYLSKQFYLWSRCRMMMVLDPRARRLMDDKPGPAGRTEYPFFGLGAGVRF